MAGGGKFSLCDEVPNAYLTRCLPQEEPPLSVYCPPVPLPGCQEMGFLAGLVACFKVFVPGPLPEGDVASCTFGQTGASLVSPWVFYWASRVGFWRWMGLSAQFQVFFVLRLSPSPALIGCSWLFLFLFIYLCIFCCRSSSLPPV